MANQQSANNEYNQTNLLIGSVPLLAHKNNYLIKLIILLNKTGLLPGPRISLMLITLYESAYIMCLLFYDTFERYSSTMGKVGHVNLFEIVVALTEGCTYWRLLSTCSSLLISQLLSFFCRAGE